MANRGPQGRTEPETVLDWMLGGAVRRRIIQRLAEPGDGWSGAALEDELRVGRAWPFEVLRVLKSIEAVEPVEGSRGRYRISQQTSVGKSLRDLLAALEEYADVPVPRPPSRTLRTQK